MLSIHDEIMCPNCMHTKLLCNALASIMNISECMVWYLDALCLAKPCVWANFVSGKLCVWANSLELSVTFPPTYMSKKLKLA